MIVVTDSGLQVPDLNRADNFAVATTTLSLSAPVLTVGTPVTGTIADGEDRYYQLDLTSPADLQIIAKSAAADGVNMYVRYGAIPDTSDYDEAATGATAASQEVTLAQPQGGVYYLLIQGEQPAGLGLSFTLTASTPGFALDGFSPGQAGNSGPATIAIDGSGFTTQTTVQLETSGEVVRAASATIYQNDTTLFATFNLTGLAPGTYDVQAIDHGETLTSAGAFTVVGGDPGQLQTSLGTVAVIRPNQTGTTVTIFYANVGGADIPAPLLQVQATNAVLGYADDSTYVGSTIQVLGIDQDGPAGILPPGYHGSITLDYQTTSQLAHTQFHFNLTQPPAPATPIDWSSAEASSRPSYLSAAAWSAIWGNFVAAAGSTAGQYQAYLDGLATYLDEIGTPTSDVNVLYNFAIQLANASLPVTAALATVDASVVTPGVPLDFARTYQPGIAARYAVGPLGRGWVDSWQISASADSQGNVTIVEDGVYLYFARQPDGTYLDPPGNDYVLTSSAGAYQVRETTGTVIAFNPDGSFHYLQDASGNRISAGYSSGQMTSLTDSSGAYLHFAYNGQGLISTITGSDGQVTTYTYDTTNELLLSVSNPEEKQLYTYVTGTNPAQQFALSTVKQTDGTYIYFTYDDQGRLIDQQGCMCATDPVSHLTYTYGSGGTVSTEDNTGDSSVIMFNQFGEPAVTEDALGLTTRLSYDSSGDLIRKVLPDGATYTYTFDSQGNELSETDPLGNTTSFTYDGQHDQTSYTDADGNTTSTTYNASNAPLSITYANGDQDQYSYNPLGEATGFLGANGAAISATYDSAGQLIEESFAGGTSLSYTYDAYGNCTSATDTLGNITKFDYGAADDGDPGDPDLLSEVLYPDGTYLKLFYNSGGQRVQSVDQTGFTVNYAYDDAGRLSKLTDSGGNLIVQYTYDADGRLIEKDNGNGTRTAYTYDPAGDELSITNYAPNHVTVNSFDNYTYDAEGDVLTDTNQDGAWAYTFDTAGQLVQAVFTPNHADPDGLAAQDFQYAYDAVGNRISQNINGVKTTYVFNSLNEYTSSTTSGVTTTYRYDAEGNLIAQTSSGGTTDYTYNALNQLTAVNGPGISETASYDALGNLVSQTVNGTTTSFQIDPTGQGNVLASFDGNGSLIAHFTYGLGLVSQVSGGGAPDFYDFNNLGSTVGVSGANGVYVNQYSYSPTGQTTTQSSGIANIFAFLGQWGVVSSPSGLDLMSVRYYAPSLGRFLSRDPSGTQGGIDLFTYADNNPVSQIDPTGLDPLELLKPLKSCPLKPFLSVPFPNPLPPGAPGPTPPGGPGPIGPLFPLIPPGTHAPQAFGLTYTWEFDDPDNPCDPPPGPPDPPAPPIPPPPPGPPGPGGGGGGGSIETPRDPNDIVGPAGFGASAFVSPAQSLPYRVDFENEATATAPAQVVEVTDQLDANLNWSTFELGAFSFGGQTYNVPAGLMSYSARINAVSSVGVYVDVNAIFNALTGMLTWTFTSIDPTTFDIPVGNVLEGFLPPDVTAPEGEGWVSYSVQPKPAVVTQTAINAQATVIFDAGLSDQSSLATAPYVNTVDAASPTSSVTALASFSPASFTVKWAGQDNTGGSGIASYSIYVSDNNGPFTLWQSATTQSSATYTGQNGHTYRFYSVAVDNVGNVQATPDLAQAETTVDAIAPSSAVNPLPGTTTATSFLVNWSGQDNSGGSGIVRYNIYVSDDGGPFTSILTGTTQTSASFTGQAGHTYSFYSVAIDTVGNAQPTPAGAQATIHLVAAPLVTVAEGAVKTNKKHQVTEVLVDFSAAVNPVQAAGTGIYRLTDAGKRGSFTAKNARKLKIRSAVYNASLDSVALTPSKPFVLTTPVQLLIEGQPPSGLEDTMGRFIDGADRGQPGSNAVAVLRRSGVTLTAVAYHAADWGPAISAAAVDFLAMSDDQLRGLRSAGAPGA